MIDQSKDGRTGEPAGANGSSERVVSHVATTPGDAPAPTTGEHEAARRASTEALMNVRASDLEPYTGLGYLSKLFRMIAVILLLVLVAEVATGIITHGTAAIPTLLGEVSRLIVLAGLLWGTGDLAMLLIDIGHDLRATRILIGRQVVHHVSEHHPSWTAHPEQAPRRAAEARPAGVAPAPHGAHAAGD